MDSKQNDIYQKIELKANEIANELKRLNRWGDEPLPESKFENMGAFGSNTMSFEQWLQFILLPRIQEIISERGQFPKGSMLAAYAIRYFDGNPDAGNLHNLLYQLDDFVNDEVEDELETDIYQESETNLNGHPQDTVTIGDRNIPPILYTLADLLPQFEGEDLENQLRTFDTFLDILSPEGRPIVQAMFLKAANLTKNSVSKLRIEKAAQSVIQGDRAAIPYDHNAAMKKYTEEHKKNYPS